jgi:hypothetical protein
VQDFLAFKTIQKTMGDVPHIRSPLEAQEFSSPEPDDPILESASLGDMPEPLDVTRASHTKFVEELEKQIERGMFPLLDASQEAPSSSLESYSSSSLFLHLYRRRAQPGTAEFLFH